MRFFAALILIANCQLAWGCGDQLTPQQLKAIGQQIFLNECNGQHQCLVDWNQGEDFPSLGIGHFIWYPENIDAGFIESFPLLIAFMTQQGADIPAWLKQIEPFSSPWQNRQHFREQQDGLLANQLRTFLHSQTEQQTAFMLQRMQQSLSVIVARSEPEIRQAIQHNIARLCQTPAGIYALIDYVNFKGEGLAKSETYKGQGWGLRQVLKEMARISVTSSNDSISAFTQAAEIVLTRRALNARNPIEKDKWLPGWKVRLRTYPSFQWPE